MSEQTYWNGYPAAARKVRVIVGKSLRPTWWCAGLEGQEREAVEVRGDGEVFYLDNEDGGGWRKVTLGRGSQRYGHSELPVSRVLASGIETEGHDRAAGRGAEHESPTAESGDAQNIAQDIGGPSQ